MKLGLKDGKIALAENGQLSTETRADLAFPNLAFLHLLSGYRSFDELAAFYQDCYKRKKSEAPAPLNMLFSKRPSNIIGSV